MILLGSLKMCMSFCDICIAKGSQGNIRCADLRHLFVRVFFMFTIVHILELLEFEEASHSSEMSANSSHSRS